VKSLKDEDTHSLGEACSSTQSVDAPMTGFCQARRPEEWPEYVARRCDFRLQRGVKPTGSQVALP